MGLVLAVFVVTIGVLGFFRADIQPKVDQARREAEVRENIAKLSQARKQAGNASNETAEEIRKKAEEMLKSNATGEVKIDSEYARPTFILLTLLLPIIGGLAFSASGRNFRNHRRYASVKEELKALEKDAQEKRLGLESAEEQLRIAQNELKKNNDPQRYEALVELNRNLYLHGYERGLNVPETLDDGATLYNRCEDAITKLVAKKSRAKFWES